MKITKQTNLYWDKRGKVEVSAYPDEYGCVIRLASLLGESTINHQELFCSVKDAPIDLFTYYVKELLKSNEYIFYKKYLTIKPTDTKHTEPTDSTKGKI